jgi:hypothetical protein
VIPPSILGSHEKIGISFRTTTEMNRLQVLENTEKAEGRGQKAEGRRQTSRFAFALHPSCQHSIYKIRDRTTRFAKIHLDSAFKWQWVCSTQETLLWHLFKMILIAGAFSPIEGFKLIFQSWDTALLAAGTLLISLIFLFSVLLFLFEREYRGKLGTKDSEIDLLKRQIDILNSQFEADRREYNRNIDKCNDEISELKEENDKQVKEIEEIKKQIRLDPLSEYQLKLKNYSNTDLAGEGLKLASSVSRLATNVKDYQERGHQQGQNIRKGHDQEMLLYNTWLSEGPKTLAIMNEIKARVPHLYQNRLHQLPDSYYQSYTMLDADNILDAISELKKAAEEFKNTLTNQI